MDAIEQLTTVVMPTIITKLKVQKQEIAGHEETLKTLCKIIDDQSDAIRKIYEAMKQYKMRIDILEARLEEKPAPAPAPEVKVRKRRTKKSEVKEEKGEWVIHPLVEKLTGDDVLSANYALAATKGNPSEAVLLMPDIDDMTMELVSRMNSKQIREIVEAHPTTVTNIDAKYAKGRWDEVD